MSYLGRSAKLSLKAQEKVSFLATAGQTVKTGLSYVPSFVEVYVNGVLLTDTTDFTATNGNSITFTVALLLNDEVTVISLKTFTVADHYSKTEADTLLAAKATNTALALKAPIASPVFTGNVGVGVTPESWSSNNPALQIGSGGVLYSHVSNGTRVSLQGNAYVNSSNADAYITTNEASQHIQEDGTHLFKVAPSGTADSAISWTTGFEVLADGKARAKNGLLFGTDTAAANALDDYEEGTFNPSGTGIDASNSVGVYTKIGNVCHTQMWILANGSTDGTITGLPFTLGTGSHNYIAVGTIGYINGSVTGVVGNGISTTLTMYNGTATGSMSSGNQMHLGLTYITT